MTTQILYRGCPAVHSVAVYQAVPQREDDRATDDVRVVVVLDVPTGTGSADHVLRLADEFGRTVSQLIPGARVRTAIAVDGRVPNGLSIDLVDRRVSIDGRPVRLAYREFAVLAYLAARPHRTVSRAVLVKEVWADRAGQQTISSRVVDTHIRRIRSKLGVHAQRLVTIRGRGYRFDPGTDTRVRITAAKTIATLTAHT
ncbi:winged helix-turn-helix domain-containing protein [Mycolicibacterium sp. 050158]|uniref:winged helix-turn-helix domain-containing protein n=1 Tax=Mycolicibacterium sp. 050158 TaxID=3090602 RepID=UPI00299F05D9|nr:winged helix-turn-helix domain-containing protein [Mycolicibacterium sp. 050158]MDX1891288.1 winged helix-turn-helix domain-containing protein [Mycolicibacterium sp. 050158]